MLSLIDMRDTVEDVTNGFIPDDLSDRDDHYRALSCLLFWVSDDDRLETVFKDYSEYKTVMFCKTNKASTKLNALKKTLLYLYAAYHQSQIKKGILGSII